MQLTTEENFCSFVQSSPNYNITPITKEYHLYVPTSGEKEQGFLVWKYPEKLYAIINKRNKGVSMSLDEIRALDVSERILLVEEIWDTIAKEQDAVPLHVEEKEILDARLNDLKENPHAQSSWEEMKERIRA